MDKTSTHNPDFFENLLRQALKSEEFPQPKNSSLEFIRNFARNIRIYNKVDDEALQKVILN